MAYSASDFVSDIQEHIGPTVCRPEQIPFDDLEGQAQAIIDGVGRLNTSRAALLAALEGLVNLRPDSPAGKKLGAWGFAKEAIDKAKAAQ